MLPALVAGARIDQPATAVEHGRLREAVVSAEAPRQPATLAARLLYGATAGNDVAAATERYPAGTLARARLAMVVATLLVSGLVYLLMSACRGGLTAMFTCLALAGFPAVLDEGYLLRPEPLAAVFVLLGCALLAAFSFVVVARIGRRRVQRVLSLAVLMLSPGIAFGIAAAALSSASVFLLVPAGMVTLAWAVQTWSWVRVLRRRRLVKRLLAPLACRSWPWFGLAAVGMASTPLVLFVLTRQGVIATQPSPSAFTLLPASVLRAAPLLLLMGLGCVRLVMESGIHLNSRRVHPSLVVVLFTALALMQYSRGGSGTCALLPATAAAMLVGEGTTTALAMLAGALLVRAQRRRREA